MKEQIVELIINCLPAIIAALTCIFTMFKIIGGLKAWKDSNDLSSISQLEKDLKNVVKQNYELQNNIAKVLAENTELKEQLKDNLSLLIDKAKENQEEKGE